MYSRGNVRGWQAIYEKKKMWGFPCHLVGEAESNPMLFRDNSETFNAPSKATVLGRDPAMRRNVPMAPLLAPHPKVRERTLGRRRAACLKKSAYFTYTYGKITVWDMVR